MEIKVIAGDIAGMETGAIIVYLFEETERLDGELARIDGALGGAISQMVSRGEIKGKPDEVTIIHTLGRLPAGRVAVAGLGKKPELSRDKVRDSAAVVCRCLQQRRVETAAAIVPDTGASRDKAAQALTEGAVLGVYSFRKHMTGEAGNGEIKELIIVAAGEADLAGIEGGVSRGRVLAEATNLARDMTNEPANFMTPSHMAEAALRIAGTYGLEASVLEREQMQELGMGGLLGVAQGSRQPPRFITLHYNGRSSGDIDLALVGKGITFDSGGISIKPAEKMEEMKGDMAGGAAVMAALSAIARLKPGVNVAAFIPATENLPDGNALKPGDILTAMNGKTIEIISTDAEGRLILADALAYANRLGAKSLVDVATLTGSIRAALGDIYTGAFSNDPGLLGRVIAAGAEAGELIWQMPMHDDFKEQLKSDVADIKNVGGRFGGAITAALFLAEFAGNTPWVHLDIAGTSLSEKERGYLVKGATGVPVRTLVNLALSLPIDR